MLSKHLPGQHDQEDHGNDSSLRLKNVTRVENLGANHPGFMTADGTYLQLPKGRFEGGLHPLAVEDPDEPDPEKRMDDAIARLDELIGGGQLLRVRSQEGHLLIDAGPGTERLVRRFVEDHLHLLDQRGQIYVDRRDAEGRAIGSWHGSEDDWEHRRLFRAAVARTADGYVLPDQYGSIPTTVVNTSDPALVRTQPTLLRGDAAASGLRTYWLLSGAEVLAKAYATSDAEAQAELQKGRVYLQPGEEPPEGVAVHEGPRGGKYFDYESGKHSQWVIEQRRSRQAPEEAEPSGLKRYFKQGQRWVDDHWEDHDWTYDELFKLLETGKRMGKHAKVVEDSMRMLPAEHISVISSMSLEPYRHDRTGLCQMLSGSIDLYFNGSPHTSSWHKETVVHEIGHAVMGKLMRHPEGKKIREQANRHYWQTMEKLQLSGKAAREHGIAKFKVAEVDAGKVAPRAYALTDNEEWWAEWYANYWLRPEKVKAKSPEMFDLVHEISGRPKSIEERVEGKQHRREEGKRERQELEARTKYGPEPELPPDISERERAHVLERVKRIPKEYKVVVKRHPAGWLGYEIRAPDGGMTQAGPIDSLGRGKIIPWEQILEIRRKRGERR